MYANHDDSLSADLNVEHIELTTYISAILRRTQDKYRICYYININGDYDIVLLVLLRSTASDYTIDIFKLLYIAPMHMYICSINDVMGA